MASSQPNNLVFVPITDELLYEHPERISGPLLPYHVDRRCHHWLAVELNPDDDIHADLDGTAPTPSA